QAVLDVPAALVAPVAPAALVVLDVLDVLDVPGVVGTTTPTLRRIVAVFHDRKSQFAMVRKA
ncbi:hypothetical protein, partial [Streptomyces kasugaensis]|uniref:hypothetical protein n=1 Tax=Streptomyces kasugaensis TaxID=1946 RepID=UPI001A95210B